MNIPTSFCIWFTPRTGSTFLCKSLELTQRAGRAGEFLNDPGTSSLAEHYQIQDFSSLKSLIWNKAMSSNKVIGLKYSYYTPQHEKIAGELNKLQNLHTETLHSWKTFEALFPNCKHIFLTRRNKIRLVVSWWKAIQGGPWHKKEGDTSEISEDFYKDKYNIDALTHLWKDHMLREAATEEFFRKNQIVPLTIVYEDFIANYEHTLAQLLTFIGVEESVPIPKPQYFEKLADKHSEKWVERFRRDVQKDWDEKRW